MWTNTSSDEFPVGESAGPAGTHPAAPSTAPNGDPLAARFGEWRARGRVALIPYLTAGFPDPDSTPGLLARFAEAGADVLELGVPFSDPLADGPTIQRASQRALQAGGSLARTLDALSAFRADGHRTAVVVFTYLNPVLAYGPDRFLADAEGAGADGVLLTDLPLDADPDLEAAFEAAPLSLVRLIAPTTTAARARAIAARAQGFAYYISRTGVTGARSELPPELAREVAELRAAATVPVAVGFGISTPDQAAAVAAVADGVVVGSALIAALDDGGDAQAVRLLEGMRRAMDAVADSGSAARIGS